MSLLFIKIHFACIYNSPFFASKQTSARIDYLRQGGRLVSRKGTQDVKFLAEKQTKTILPYTHAQATTGKTRTFIFRLHRIFVQYFAHERGVYLVLQHKDNKLLSIYRNIKSQDDFNILISFPTSKRKVSEKDERMKR